MKHWDYFHWESIYPQSHKNRSRLIAIGIWKNTGEMLIVWVLNKKSPLCRGFLNLLGGADGTRTRDPRRDRPIF